MRRCMFAAVACAMACGRYTATATVTIAVSGPGAVRGAQLQGDCRATCWFPVAREVPVHLEPVIDAHAVFTGWAGACSGTGACDLKPGYDVSVAATFIPATPRRLQVSLNGAGELRSDPAGIDCPRTCAADFPEGTAVSLQTTAAPGWEFTGFGGACSGPACTISLSSDMTAWATFLERPVKLSVQISGGGSVSSSPAGIDCPRTCSAWFVRNTVVELDAAPAAAFSFAGFSGSCSGSGCSLRLTSDAQVNASFADIPPGKLSVVVDGSGAGRVTSSPAGIDCPGACSASFAAGTAVTLSAAPDLLSKFTSWSGACSADPCTLAVKGDAAIAAEFRPRRYTVQDLGTPPGGSWSTATAISPGKGLVAGGWSSGTFFRDGAMRDMGLPGDVRGVNDAGVVIGTSDRFFAYRWESGAGTQLNTMGGMASFANGINGDGMIVGWIQTQDAHAHAVYWTSRMAVMLGSLDDDCSFAYGVNSGGVIVGASCVALDRPDMHAVRFRNPGVIDDLGTLGGSYGLARAINDSGLIVGESTYDWNTPYHGFVYKDGRMIDAGVPAGMTYSSLWAVNATGVAVGLATDGGPKVRGILHASGRVIDLNMVVEPTPYLITHAYGIDDAGEIAAQGSAGGSVRALLLSPE